MHRKFVSILLAVQLLLIMLVVTFNSFNPQSASVDSLRPGLMLVGALSIYTLFLFVYFRKRAFLPIVAIGTALYFVLNLAIYLLFAIRSQQDNSLLIFSVTFIPGIYASFSYFVYLMRDHKERKANA